MSDEHKTRAYMLKIQRTTLVVKLEAQIAGMQRLVDDLKAGAAYRACGGFHFIMGGINDLQAGLVELRVAEDQQKAWAEIEEWREMRKRKVKA